MMECDFFENKYLRAINKLVFMCVMVCLNLPAADLQPFL